MLTEKLTQKSLLDTKEKVIAAYYSCLIFEESKRNLSLSLENLNTIQSETSILVKEGLIEAINEDQINLLYLSMENQIAQLRLANQKCNFSFEICHRLPPRQHSYTF